MKKDTLYYFSSPQDFMKFYDELDIYNGWKIDSGLLNVRGEEIRDKSYTKKLKSKFYKSDFFRKQVSIAEVVSWLDTMTIMYRYLTLLNDTIDHEIYDNLGIHVEYMIQMSKKMRVDYVLEYNDTLLLIEFRTVSNFEKIRPTWELKFRELLVYKELIGYYLPIKKIILYAFISMFEYDNRQLVPKHKNYNNNQIRFLIEYTTKYLFVKNENV